jgi:hypothetical protein
MQGNITPQDTLEVVTGFNSLVKVVDDIVVVVKHCPHTTGQ